jgi:hypothetical protein
MSSPTVNLIVSLSIRRCPSKFMNVMMWAHCNFDSSSTISMCLLSL